MTQKLSLEALDVLDAIDRKGSFAAAAAALYKVPSAITYTVQKLEEDLGVSLFKREGRKAELTPAGQLLLTQGRVLLEAATRLTEATQQLHRGWEPRLTIAVDTLFPTEQLYPLLEQFYALQPEIEITLINEVLGGSWEAIIEQRADLVIGADAPDSTFKGLQSQQLTEIHWVFAAAPHHPLAELAAQQAAPLTQDDIVQYRAIIVGDSSRNLPPKSRRIFEKQPLLRVASMQEKVHCQAAGLGVGFLPLHRIQSELQQGQLVALPFTPAPSPVGLYMGWKRGSKGKALRWFVEHLPTLELDFN